MNALAIQLADIPNRSTYAIARMVFYAYGRTTVPGSTHLAATWPNPTVGPQYDSTPNTRSPSPSTNHIKPPGKKTNIKTALHPYRRVGITVLTALLLFIAIIFLVGWYYHARALPGVWMGNQAVQAKNHAQLESLARTQARRMGVTFVGANMSVQANLQDIGIHIDLTISARNALKTKRGSLKQQLQLWQIVHSPLAYSFDEKTFVKYMSATFPDQWVSATNATISYNAGTRQYQVVPGVNGRGIDKNEVLRRLNQATYDPQPVAIRLTTAPIKPLIGDVPATDAQTTANRYLASDIKITQHGATIFTLEPHEIATLLDVVVDEKRRTVHVNPNADKIAAFVGKDIASTVARATRNQIAITNPSNGYVSTVQPGIAGQQLDDQTQLAAAILDALTKHVPLKTELKISQKPFETTTFTGTTRWIDVNLTSQTTRLMLDTTPIATFRISSGRPATPTDPGEHYIRSKYPTQTMSGTINGESYYVPNIPWVSYFDADNEAFHGTYWHNNFGTPMSHGCINMTIADAKILYDYAPLGTRVSVHY